MARAIGDLVADSGALDPDEELVLPPSWNVAPTADVAVVLEKNQVDVVRVLEIRLQEFVVLDTERREVRVFREEF